MYIFEYEDVYTHMLGSYLFVLTFGTLGAEGSCRERISVSISLSPSEVPSGLNIVDPSGRGNIRPPQTSRTTSLQLDRYLNTKQ